MNHQRLQAQLETLVVDDHGNQLRRNFAKVMQQQGSLPK
jgi:hypothetical protein